MRNKINKDDVHYKKTKLEKVKKKSQVNKVPKDKDRYQQ